MRITVLSVPYDLGREGEGVALGPGRYLDGGLVAALCERGHQASVVAVERPEPFTDELSAVVGIARVLAGEARRAVASGSFPLVAGGNCNVALGMTAGLGPADTAVVWFDAHGDYNTPQTTPSGFLDGMPLAMATGRAHGDAWAQKMGAVDPRLRARRHRCPRPCRGPRRRLPLAGRPHPGRGRRRDHRHCRGTARRGAVSDVLRPEPRRRARHDTGDGHRPHVPPRRHGRVRPTL